MRYFNPWGQLHLHNLPYTNRHEKAKKASAFPAFGQPLKDKKYFGTIFQIKIWTRVYGICVDYVSLNKLGWVRFKCVSSLSFKENIWILKIERLENNYLVCLDLISSIRRNMAASGARHRGNTKANKEEKSSSGCCSSSSKTSSNGDQQKRPFTGRFNPK